jgi:aerobic-type carbon monoxide dehydrogenase small subunit (CoxS/CutS family)
MPTDRHIEIGTILSHRTKTGMVELTVNGEKAQMEIAKAREVCQMLHQAIEAAITDTLIYQFMVERIGMDDQRASQVLLDFRELRQGSKSVVYPQ